LRQEKKWRRSRDYALTQQGGYIEIARLEEEACGVATVLCRRVLRDPTEPELAAGEKDFSLSRCDQSGTACSTQSGTGRFFLLIASAAMR